MRHQYRCIDISEARLMVSNGYWPEHIVQLKVDGVWAKATYTGGPDVIITGRSDDEIGLLPVDSWQQLHLCQEGQDCWEIVGEWVGGVFYAFDSLTYGESAYAEREAHLDMIASIGIDGIEVLGSHPITDLDDVWAATLDQPDDYDGIIIIDPSQAYNAQPHIKCKHVVCVDMVVSALLYSKAGHYEGRPHGVQGAYWVDGKLVDVCKVPNMPHKYTKQMAKDPESFIGRVFEARGQKIFEKTGSLRHPVFSRFRDDKPVHETTNPKGAK
tara:strand:- start:2730 stop:3539 length:810 start_codon:yes stop_codon:yes gene_type:complete